MKKIKDILGVLFYPIVLLVAEFISIIVFTLIFNLTSDYKLGTLEYTEKLGLFFANNRLWMLILMFLMLIPMFKKKCKIEKIKFNIKDIGLMILLGLLFSLTYNLILININNVFKFTNIFEQTNINIVITLLASGVVGPITEELIFRNIVYEKSKKIFRPIMAILFTGLLFGVCHGNMIQFIYAFLFNFLLIYVYEKYKSVYAPIIVHISANSGLQLFLFLVNYNNSCVSIVSLIICSLSLFISYKLMNKKEC